MLNIVKEIMLAWKPQSGVSLCTAEVLPIGDTSYERKKISDYSTKFNLKKYDNIPLPGFTLFKADSKTSATTTDQLWSVIDPRGFLVKITSDNLEDILHVTGITEGLIQEKCVWARNDSGTKMILTPVTSNAYQVAIRNTSLLDEKIDIKNVNIGDLVLLQNGLVGKYMGTVSLYSSYFEPGQPPVSYLRRQVIEVEPNKYHYQTNAKILKVITPSPVVITKEESVKYMMDNIRHSYFTSSSHIRGRYYGPCGKIVHVSTHSSVVDITLEEITSEEAVYIFRAGVLTNDIAHLVFEDANGVMYTILYPWTSDFLTKPINGLIEIKFIPGKPNVIAVVGNTDRVVSSWPTLRRNYKQFDINQLDLFSKIYKTVKHVKNETYTYI